MSALTTYLFPSRDDDPTSLDIYEKEIESGLVNHQQEIDEALRNSALYDMDAVQYIQRRDAETPFDFEGRPKRESAIVRQIVDILCEHLYAPGPQRTYSDPDAQEFLEKVWEQNNYNALWNMFDRQSTLNDVVAVQVDAGQGDFDECPLTLRPWSRQEFVVWTHPNDSRVPVAVVTIDRYDLTTTYRLWNDKEVRTYITKKATGTSGGRVANRISVEPHEYGILPFFFVHYELPTTRFCTPGIGDFAARAELNINDMLSRLAESIQKHLNPVPIAENLPKDWAPILEPQRFIRLVSAGRANTSSAGWQPTGDAKLSYLSATIDVAGAWLDMSNYVKQVLEAARVPLSAYRMEQTGVASGISLVIEQLPLLSRAKKRQHPFQVFECCAVKVILTCAGNHYGVEKFITAAKTGVLTLQWPQFTLPIGTLDRNQLDQSDLDLNVKSLLMVIQERNGGCTREKAIEILEQIAEDKKMESQISGPAPAAPPGLPGGPPPPKALEGKSAAPGSEDKGPGTDPEDLEGETGDNGA